MTARVEELLVEYALGTIDENDRKRVEEELSQSRDLQRELQIIEESLAEIALDLPPIAPSPGARAKLLAAIDGDPFAPFVDRVAEMFDLGMQRMREIFTWIDNATKWESGPLEGVQLMHFEGGPRLAGVDTGLVRMAAGLHFPPHRHDGEERSMILRGTYYDEVDGKTYGPGDMVVMPAGSEHSFVVGKEEDLLFALALKNGIQFVYKQ